MEIKNLRTLGRREVRPKLGTTILALILISLTILSVYYSKPFGLFMVAPFMKFEAELCAVRQYRCYWINDRQICPESFTYIEEKRIEFGCPARPETAHLYECLQGSVKLKSQESACWSVYTSYNCMKPSNLFGLVVEGNIPSNSKIRVLFNGHDFGYLQETLYRQWIIPFTDRNFTWHCSNEPNGNCYNPKSVNGNEVLLFNEGLTEIEIKSVEARLSLETRYECIGALCYPKSYLEECK